MEFNFGILLKENIQTIMLNGNPRTGKTSLAYTILNDFKQTIKELNLSKEIYICKHPNPQKITDIGFKTINNLEDITKIKNAIVWFDEPQLYMPLDEKKANEKLQKLLTIAGQRNLLLFFSTNDTRWVTKGLEAYIQIWLLKDIDYDLVKQGSKIKQIIKENTIIDPSGFRLPKESYILHTRQIPNINGKYTFKQAEYFNEELSNPYANTD